MDGYLLDFNDWDENFARGMALKVGIISGLSEDHWKIINFIRDYFKRTGKCPLIYETCRMNRLRLPGLKKLFHAGYLRGACKLAGVTYMEGYLVSGAFRLLHIDRAAQEKQTFEVNIQGFLINPQQWNEMYAIYKAQEMKMPLLTDKHWQVINFLRQSFEQNNLVPTVYETCEAGDIGLKELQRLFPDGYHRGAVKIAGLRAR
jgi:tRNA 2-thiouridine synthesizing protein E